MINKYDNAVLKAHGIEQTRPPEKIQADIETQQAIQKEAVRVTMELTRATRRNHRGPLQKIETMVDNPVQVPTVAKQREKYDAAAVRIDELQHELVVAQQVRS